MKFLVFFLYSSYAFSQAIGISQVSNLNFPGGLPGDARYTIPPGTSENAENASFLITVSANTAYSIDLPRSANMQHETTGDTIKVDQFNSTPAEGNNGLLDSSGNQMLYIGARRAKLTNNQDVGNYSISFTITVVY